MVSAFRRTRIREGLAVMREKLLRRRSRGFERRLGGIALGRSATMDRGLHPFTEARMTRQAIGHYIRPALMLAAFLNAPALGLR